MEEVTTAAATRIDEIFNDSYERCLKNSDFIDQCYETYVASFEVVAETIANTNMTGPIGMIEAPLYKIMALRTLPPEDAMSHLRKIGPEYVYPQQETGPVYYDLWQECLLKTVAECDDKYDSEVQAAWTEVLASGIKIMKSAA